MQQLQVRTTTRDIPVVVYSNMDDDVDDEFIKSFGDAAGCLHKSVMYEDFVAALQQAGVAP